MNKSGTPLLKSLGLRILALVLAFISWFLVTNFDDYTIAKTIRNIPVTQLNGDEILKSGSVYDVTDGDTTSITVRGPRSVVDGLTASDFSASADLSELSLTNATEIHVTAVNSDVASQISIHVINNMMKLSVEQKAEATLPVKVYTTGNVAEGYALGTAVTTPNIITVSGPQSVLSTITEVRAVVDVSGQSDTLTKTVSLSCTDAYGRSLERKNIELSASEVSVTVPVYPIREVNIHVSTTGNPKTGYAVKNIEYNPATIEIAGPLETIESIEELHIQDIDVTGAAANIEQNVDLSSYLPDGTILADPDAMLAVSVKIEALVDHKIPVTAGDIKLSNKNGAYEYSVSLPEDASYTVNGFSENVSDLTAADISPHLDVYKLEEGEYEIPVKTVDSDLFTTKGSVTATITITKKPETDTEKDNSEKQGE